MPKELPRSTPEAQGIASSAMLAFVEALDLNIHNVHSFMLLRHGHVVAEGWWSPYRAEYPHMLFSLSKSFTATAIGLAIQEGLVSLDDPVLSFFPDDAPVEVSENLAAMRVRHLLSMSTGHAADTMAPLRPNNNWAQGFLSQPVEHEPGTHFVYNSGATYMLSAIVQAVSGVTLLTYLQPRLLTPLGIEGATWETCPRGINTGGWGMSITTADIARFGQFYLQRGEWHGKRILPAEWVEAATTQQVSNGTDANSDWAQGYGYQFWRSRHGAYRGDGAFGQYCIVMPEQDAVLAMTSGVANMQAPLNLVWQHLLPAMGSAPLPDNHVLQGELRQKLASLSLPLAQGQRTSPLAAQIAAGKTYLFEPNERHIEAASLECDPKGCFLTVRDQHGEHCIECGHGVWLHGTTTLATGIDHRIAASGAWTSEDTYVAQIWFSETPFCTTITCHFSANELLFTNKVNVSFGPTEYPQLRGRAA